ncbi:MAG: hypothetical protein M1839_006782 [Geoglossum umbratile]|nr:MAG: hypothetical protein M1839_006782 [Geoglossum umbratile]
MENSSSELSEVIVSSPSASSAAEHKLDKYLLLQREDRWTVYDLVESLVKSEKREKSLFIRRLHENKVVLDTLISYNKDDVLDHLNRGATQLTKEVELLASTSYFGKWKLSQVDSFFNLDAPAILEIIEQHAPRLLSFLRALMGPSSSS